MHQRGGLPRTTYPLRQSAFARRASAGQPSLSWLACPAVARTASEGWSR